MSLADDLRGALDDSAGVAQPARKPAPDGLRWEWDGNTGVITTPPLAERPTTWDEFIRKSGLEPEDVEVIEPVGLRGWQGLQRNEDGTNSVVDLNYYSLKVRRRSPVMAQLPLLFNQARRINRLPRVLPDGVDRATIVCWADPQTGKVARRGGTPALVERVGVYLDKLADYLDRVPSDAAMLFDLGDAVENFENTGQQMSTNDLSLMDQVDVAGTLLFHITALLAQQRNAVGVRGIGSNHCRWRKGKDALGQPSDDWGIFLLKQLRKAVQSVPGLAHVDVAWPDRFEETLSVEVCGKVLGLAHGHQASKPELVPTWWGKQVHGGQPLAHADILHTGHFHHLRVQPTGRNPWTDRSKWWLQAPTADNGSDWYRMSSGDDSDPGLVVYTLTRGQDGFPFGNLEIL